LADEQTTEFRGGTSWPAKRRWIFTAEQVGRRKDHGFSRRNKLADEKTLDFLDATSWSMKRRWFFAAEQVGW